MWKVTNVLSVQDWRKRLFELLTVSPTLKISFSLPAILKLQQLETVIKLLRKIRRISLLEF